MHPSTPLVYTSRSAAKLERMDLRVRLHRVVLCWSARSLGNFHTTPHTASAAAIPHERVQPHTSMSTTTTTRIQVQPLPQRAPHQQDTSTSSLPLPLALAALYDTMAAWFTALFVLLTPAPGLFRTRHSTCAHTDCSASSALLPAQATRAKTRAPVRSTLQELVEAADDACRVLRCKLPQRELLQQVADFLVDTRVTGNSGALEWRYMNIAARFGCMDLLHVLLCSTSGSRIATTSGCTSNGNLCSSRDALVCTSDAIDFAAQHGHLRAVKWLHCNVRDVRCTVRAMDFAAANDHLDVVQWLHAHRSEGCSTAAMDGAAAAGHLTTLKWLAANRTEGCTARALDLAAQNGHLTVVQWLVLEHQPKSDSKYDAQLAPAMACKYAAINGHVDVLQWLVQHHHKRVNHSAVAMRDDIKRFARYADQAPVLRWCAAADSVRKA